MKFTFEISLVNSTIVSILGLSMILPNTNVIHSLLFGIPILLLGLAGMIIISKHFEREYKNKKKEQ